MLRELKRPAVVKHRAKYGISPIAPLVAPSSSAPGVRGHLPSATDGPEFATTVVVFSPRWCRTDDCLGSPFHREPFRADDQPRDVAGGKERNQDRDERNRAPRKASCYRRLHGCRPDLVNCLTSSSTTCTRISPPPCRRISTRRRRGSRRSGGSSASTASNSSSQTTTATSCSDDTLDGGFERTAREWRLGLHRRHLRRTRARDTSATRRRLGTSKIRSSSRDRSTRPCGCGGTGCVQCPPQRSLGHLLLQIRNQAKILQATSTTICVSYNPLKKRQRGFDDSLSPSANIVDADSLSVCWSALKSRGVPPFLAVHC
jgi:hypothetical protein